MLRRLNVSMQLVKVNVEILRSEDAEALRPLPK